MIHAYTVIHSLIIHLVISCVEHFENSVCIENFYVLFNWNCFCLFFNLAPFFSRVSLSRKTSEDLPASEYYKIYQQSKKNSTNIIPENNVVDIVEPLEEALDMESKTEVKVQGGGIAER